MPGVSGIHVSTVITAYFVRSSDCTVITLRSIPAFVRFSQQKTGKL